MSTARIMIALSLFSLFAGCGKDDRNKNAVQAVIEEEVNNRVQNYRDRKSVV